MNKKHIVSICMTLTMLISVMACGMQTPVPASSPTQGTTEESTPNTEKTISFDSETVYGDIVSQDVFAGNDLTLVNIFATWCGPCVEEIPSLQEIDRELDNVDVVGIVADTYVAQAGERREKAIELPKKLLRKPTQNILL